MISTAINLHMLSFPQLSEEIWSFIFYELCDGSTLADLVQVATASAKTSTSRCEKLQPPRIQEGRQYDHDQTTRQPAIYARHLLRTVIHAARRRCKDFHYIVSNPSQLRCGSNTSFQTFRMIQLLERLHYKLNGSDAAGNIVVRLDHVEQSLLVLDFIECGVYRRRADSSFCCRDWPVWMGEIVCIEDASTAPLCKVTNRINVVIYSPWWWHMFGLHKSDKLYSTTNELDNNDTTKSSVYVGICHHNVVPTPPMGRICGIRPQDKGKLEKVRQRLVERNEVLRSGTSVASPTTWFILSPPQAKERAAKTFGSQSATGKRITQVLNSIKETEKDNELVCCWQFQDDDHWINENCVEQVASLARILKHFSATHKELSVATS